MSVNKAILIGNLGTDPEIKYTQAGKAVTKRERRRINHASMERQGGGVMYKCPVCGHCLCRWWNGYSEMSEEQDDANPEYCPACGTRMLARGTVAYDQWCEAQEKGEE